MLLRKLRSQRGESLAEVLVALLIIAMATLLLAAMVHTAGSMDMAARGRDEHFYAELTAAETGEAYGPEAPTGPAAVTMQVMKGSGGTLAPDPASAPATVNVTLYGGDHLIAYKKAP